MGFPDQQKSWPVPLSYLAAQLTPEEVGRAEFNVATPMVRDRYMYQACTAYTLAALPYKLQTKSI